MLQCSVGVSQPRVREEGRGVGRRNRRRRGRGRLKGGGRERISGEGIGSFKENLLVNSEP